MFFLDCYFVIEIAYLDPMAADLAFFLFPPFRYSSLWWKHH